MVAQLSGLESKLSGLKGGTVLVTPEERAAVEKELGAMMDHWRRRKGIFREIWWAGVRVCVRDAVLGGAGRGAGTLSEVEKGWWCQFNL